MSCYETHRGVLKKVDTDNIRQYLFSLTNDNKILNEDYNVSDFIYENNLENKYIIIKNGLYELLEHNDITYDDKRGYLCISHTGITYTSISYDNKLNIVFVENTDNSYTNIFDCFIKTLQWLSKNKSNITINFWN